MTVIPLPVPEIDQLRRDLALARDQLRIIGALHMAERFHAFDAIKDDKCPCCGARVKVNRDHNSVMLEAV